MNKNSVLRLRKYASATLRMSAICSRNNFTTLNFATNSSSHLQNSKNEPVRNLKHIGLHEKPNNTKSPQRIFHNTKLNDPRNDPDVFGNLSEKACMWYPDMHEPSKEDNDLSDDSVIVKNLSKRFRCPETYMKEMKRLVQEKKVKEALDLFVDMRRNFVTPLHYHFTYMIGVCGRIGYTEMAFNLLRQMSDRCYQPTSATLTGLFNACAESPFPEYALKKAQLLKDKIAAKSWPLNSITYRVMIKAFGKCGDLDTAFQIVDEMAEGGFEIDVKTYSFLLMSCVAKKETGFTYAVQVWRKMQAKKCRPNLFTCNLLLRAARDCDVGPEEISSLLLEHWSHYPNRPYGFLTKDKVNTTAHQLPTVLESSVVPKTEVTSLLSVRPVDGPEISGLLDIKTPSDRLNLIGGWEGFLQMMSTLKVKPDIKTFTLLLECLPPNLEEEEKLLLSLDSHTVKPDVDFLNMLIKRRNFRKDSQAAKNVLVLINKYELTPNIMTFGVLALGCKTLHQATLFIAEMEKFGSCPNIEIVGGLLRQACGALDFSYMKYVMRMMEERQIKANERLLMSLEKTLADTRKSILQMEQGKTVEGVYLRDNLKGDFKEFCVYYNRWLKRVHWEAEQHPWLQYQTDIVDRQTDST